MDSYFSDIIQILGLSSIIFGGIMYYYSIKDRKIKITEQQFILIRKYIKGNRKKLHNIALQYYINKKIGMKKNFPLLAKEEWILNRPLLLENVLLELRKESANEEIISIDKHILPIDEYNKDRYENYSEAIRKIDPPKVFDNRDHYRLQNVEITDETYKLIYYDESSSTNKTKYYDKINYGGILEYEVGQVLNNLNTRKKGKSKINEKSIFRKLKLRKKFINPFDFRKFKVVSGINTLTLIKNNDTLRFIMHYRDNVGFNVGTYSVIPAGEFQPSSCTPLAYKNDFDLWKNILREYAEELGIKDEYEGKHGQSYDYNREPIKSLNNYRNERKIKAYFLGFGLDPLTLQGEILTVVVFDHNIFKKIFPTIHKNNNEGLFLTDQDQWGYELTEDNINAFLQENITPNGQAILELLKKHRAVFLS